MTQTKRPVKGIHRVKKKLASGPAAYHYAWRGGPRFWSSTDRVTEDGPAYWAAYQKAVEGYAPAKGKFRQILQAFLSSRDYQKLAPRTQEGYQDSIRHVDGIDAKFGDAPLGAFNSPSIRKIAYAWRDGFSSDRVADMQKAHLVAIVNWAVDRGYLQTNYLAGMSNLYKVDRSEIIWTPEDLTLFLYGNEEKEIGPAPEWLKRLMISATETGLRPGDLMLLSRSHIKKTPKGRRIQIRTAKRKRMVSIPVTPRMSEVIDTTPMGQMVIVASSKGAPFTNSRSLGRAVARRRSEVGIRSELHLYDARGTAVTRLFEAGANLREIALHMGWSIDYASRMIGVYAALNPEGSDALLIKLHVPE
jgi:integrase